MEASGFDVVTGAFAYTGKYITQRLLSSGRTVKTLTGHPNRPNPFGGKVAAVPFNFDNPVELVRNLEGADALFNTYWIRFPRGAVTYDYAVENTLHLIQAAKEAGLRRFVQVSIANASEDSPFPYYRGKAVIERALARSGLSYAIIRPTVLFGHEGILINNIAWILRHMPLFTIPGDGRYGIQPIHVEDVADIAVRCARGTEDTELDAAGPERYTFEELVRLIRDVTKARAGIVHLGPVTVYLMVRLFGYLMGDVILTLDEVRGLMGNLLVSGEPPLGRTSLRQWLLQNADTVGSKYESEIKRHYK